MDILAHQIIGFVIDGIEDKDEIYNYVKKSYVFNKLEKKEFDSVIDFLVQHYLLRFFGNKLIRTKKGLLFYINNISSIPDRKNYLVIDSQLNEKIGSLDEEFVAENGQIGSFFVMKGETWKIVKIEGQKISVIRAENSLASIPAWEGELMPVHRFVAEKAADLRKEFINKFSVLKEQSEDYIIPDKNNVLIERLDEYIVIHSSFGSMINEGLAKAISTKISDMIGESVLSKTDPYRIIIKTLLPPNEIKNIIVNIDDVEELIKRNIERSTLFEYRFLNVAKRFGIINKNTEGELNVT